MAENFNLIFGSNAPDSTTWSDADYQTGWSTVGSTPPTAEQFDFLQNRADLKAKELKDTLDPLVTKATEEGRQPSTPYALDDTATADGLPTAWFLECTTAGTTDASAITIPSPLTEGDIISDGTVVWTIRKAVCENDYSKTSFGTAVVNHLLGSTLATLVDAVSTDSLFSKLLKKALEAAGLRYSVGTNGYICLGSLFGNLILQWGQVKFPSNTNSLSIQYPISFTTIPSILINSVSAPHITYMGITHGSVTTANFMAQITRTSDSRSFDLWGKWISIGY